MGVISTLVHHFDILPPRAADCIDRQHFYRHNAGHVYTPAGAAPAFVPVARSPRHRKDHRLRQAGTITVLPLNAFLRRLTNGDVLR